jgi:hypothetical protein
MVRGQSYDLGETVTVLIRKKFWIVGVNPADDDDN